jgi:hypothetical protein
MSGRTERGNTVRIPNVLDEFTRKCLLMLVAPSIAAQKVIQALDRLFLTRARPTIYAATMVRSSLLARFKIG